MSLDHAARLLTTMIVAILLVLAGRTIIASAQTLNRCSAAAQASPLLYNLDGDVTERPVVDPACAR